MSSAAPRWLPALIDKLALEPAVVRVVVCQVQGSTPREPGACMLVDPAGLTGTIGGGRLEWEAIEAAQAMLRQGARAARVMNRVLGIDLGQCCGGVAAIWLECFPQECRPQLQALAAAVTGPLVLSTTATADGVRQSVSGGAAAAQAPATRMLRGRDGEITLLERLDESLPEVWLYGAGHVGRSLAGMLAQLPLRLFWQDSRTGQLPPEAGGYSRCVSQPRLVRSVCDAPPGTHFVVMTHDHGLDYDLCRTVLLRDDAGWLGLIGSHSKGARFRSRLRREGFRASVIERLVCPIGVAGIGSKWPAAIAVAVAAQVLQILTPSVTAGTGANPDVAPRCAAQHCESCGRHDEKIKGTVVTGT